MIIKEIVRVVFCVPFVAMIATQTDYEIWDWQTWGFVLSASIMVGVAEALK